MSIGVRWHKVTRMDMIPSLLSELKELYRSVQSLLPYGGEPLKMHGNHRVLVFKGPFGIMIKIEGPQSIIFALKHILDKIRNGEIQENDYTTIRDILKDYKYE